MDWVIYGLASALVAGLVFLAMHTPARGKAKLKPVLSHQDPEIRIEPCVLPTWIQTRYPVTAIILTEPVWMMIEVPSTIVYQGQEMASIKSFDADGFTLGYCNMPIRVIAKG